MSYDLSARLEAVTGPFGRTLSFTYDASDRVDTMTDPEGNVYGYGYDAFQNLISVTYPDETPADDTDNPVRLAISFLATPSPSIRTRSARYRSNLLG